MQQNDLKKLNIDELEQVKGGLETMYVPPFLYEDFVAKYEKNNQGVHYNK